MTLAAYTGSLLIPGMGNASFSQEHDLSGLIYGSLQNQTFAPYAVIDGASRDAGNTGNDTVLRIGLVMSFNTSTNKWTPFVSGGANGVGSPQGILVELGLNTQFNGANADRFLATILVMGCVYPTGVCIAASAAYGIDRVTASHINVRKGFKYNIRFADDFGSYLTDPMAGR